MEHVSRCSGGVAKLLHLHVKGKYFDDIKSGTKTEEYRQFATWVKKLLNPDLSPTQYDGIVLYRGYPKRDDPERTLERPWRGYEIKKVKHPEFGPRAVNVFAIRVN